RIIIYDERPQEAKKLSTKLTLGKKERLIRIGCFYNKLPELDISGCPKLTLLYCENNELTSLDVSHNPYLKTFHCLDNSLTHLDVSNNPKLVELYIDYKLLDNITGLEKTSIVRLDCRGGAFPEMKLINVDDLTEWAGQVNEETVKDEKFLAKVCPTRCLIIINRLYTKAKDEEYEQHLENLAKQSLKCMSMNPKYPQASLYESRAKLVQQALTPDYELLEDDMERENNCGRLANG
ncbi:6278_t:CDS:2, partial [Racocetra persica]